MLTWILVFALVLCMLSGLLLRHAPFAHVVPRYRRKLLYTLYGVLTAAVFVICGLLLHYKGPQIILFLLQSAVPGYGLLLSVVNMILIPGYTKEHLLALGVTNTCHFLLLSVPDYITSLLQDTDALTQLITFVGIYLLLIGGVHWPFRKLLKSTIEPFLSLKVDKYGHTVFFAPIALYGAMTFVLLGTETTDKLLQVFSSLFSGGMIVLLCLGMISDTNRMKQQETMQKQLEGQKLHYAELEFRVEEARKNRHDFKHHIAAIHHYMDIDDKEGLRSYCSELMERTGNKEQIPYTGNAAADGVLYNCLQRAKPEKIAVRYSGTVHSRGIADVDLCTLLGNALDNAIAGCLTVETGRQIEMLSQSEPHVLSIVVRNTFDGKILQSENGILSRKRKNRKGVGLASMQAICKQYGGSMDYTWDENNFTVVFVLPLTEEA